MGKRDLKRRDFFRRLAGQGTTEAADVTTFDDAGKTSIASPSDLSTDPLFRKYSRKTIGARRSAPSGAPVGETDGVDGRTGGDDGGAAARVGNVTSGLTPYSGAWTKSEAMHLLRRIGFGLKKARVESLMNVTMSAAVDALTDLSAPMTLPSATPINNYQASTADSGGVAAGADWTQVNLLYTSSSASADGNTDAARRGSLFAWSWGRFLSDDATIREKMMMFWYHFIPVGIYDVETATSTNSTLTTYYYTKLLRDNALGNFRTLIEAVSKHPAMLLYLSNQFSTAATPNENYGRELLELFTMGKAPTQNYTEDDVKAAAKCLSGWRCSSFKTAFAAPMAAQPYPVSFNNSYHNQTAQKIFSSNFGNTQIANSTTGGEFAAFFNMLFAHQGTTIAKYVVRRLYRFFVYYDIDANVEMNVIAPLAAALVSANWEMLGVVRTLLKSEHFYDMVNRGVMIKSPLDLIAGTARTLNLQHTVGTLSTLQQYNLWTYFHNWAKNNMEQSLIDVPNVSGWKAYYQSPGYYQNWINSNTILQRAKFLTAMVNGANVTVETGTPNITSPIKLDPIAWIQQFSPAVNIAVPEDLLDAVIPYIVPVPLDQAYIDQLRVSSLQGGLASQPNVNNPWTTAWNAYNGNSNTTNTNVVLTRLRSMFDGLLQLAEAQLM